MISPTFKRIRNEISTLVNASIASAKIRKLEIHETKGIYSMRPPIHLVLHAPVGQIKSTILQEIANAMKSTVMLEITRAGLVGTLDGKTSQMIPGAAWECRN